MVYNVIGKKTVRLLILLKERNLGEKEMKKLVLLASIVALLLLAACGNKSSEDKAGNTEAQNTDEQVEDLTEEGPKNFEIKEKIDQLGNQGFPTEKSSVSDDIGIFEKEGETYFVSPIEEPSEGLVKLSVSILKDGEWTVKDKITDISKAVYNLDSVTLSDNQSVGNVYFDYMQFGSNYYISVRKEFFGTTPPELPNALSEIYKFTFTSDGDVKSEKLISNTDEGNDFFDKVIGKDKQYFMTTKGENEFVVYDDNGNDVYHGTDASSVDFQFGLNYFLINDTLYSGPIRSMKGYDLKNNDLIWNEDGSEKEFQFIDAIGKEIEQVQLLENGYYTLSNYGSDNVSLNYSEFSEDGLNPIVNSIQIPSDLDVENAMFTMNEDSVNVYTTVIYKGKPTVQKYVISRID
ncbi:hypothetical protein 7F23_60 [uncultured Caudovirales phage]|uniref:Uncharacterized protein n=1 Tax=uncultured Caudovirales phage TaxID=2100421 RepID=A0A2H4J575_9CAUD|nr:hypothetical protein 7F23_60 [uncultured Caudovirales phage]